MNLKGIFSILKETVNEWLEDDSFQLSAALAYYTIFSLAPLLVLSIAIAGVVFEEEAARGEIQQQISGFVGPQGAEFIQEAIQNASNPDQKEPPESTQSPMNTAVNTDTTESTAIQSQESRLLQSMEPEKRESSGGGQITIAAVISIIVLFFGASGVFVQLQTSMNKIWNVKQKPDQGFLGILRVRLTSFTMVLGIGFLLMVSLILSTVIKAMSNFMSDQLPGTGAIWQTTDLVVSFIVITLLFAMIFKYLPDVKIKWSDVWFGAIITALLFTVGKYALSLYLGSTSFGSAYGAAGSVIVLLAWIYYSSLILFFGAEFTQVYARRSGTRIEPTERAMRIT